MIRHIVHYVAGVGIVLYKVNLKSVPVARYYALLFNIINCGATTSWPWYNGPIMTIFRVKSGFIIDFNRMSPKYNNTC